MSSEPELTVVVPVYCSASTLRDLVRRLDTALRSERVEYVFVVDGSPDESEAVLLSLQRERSKNTAAPRLRVLSSASNLGQHRALCAGFRSARGRGVIALDADLQYAPEDLPKLIGPWRRGADLVAGHRTMRTDAYRTRVLPSRAFNAFAQWWSGVALRDFGCGFCLCHARLLPRVLAGGARRRFLKPLLGSLAERAVEVEVEPGPRRSPSAYGSLRLARLALEFAVGWSARPYLAIALSGALLSLAGAVLLAVGARSLAQAVLVLGLCSALLGGAMLVVHACLQRDGAGSPPREIAGP